MTIQYTPRGSAPRSFTIQVEDGLIQSVQVVGGCSGNLQGISMLLKGMTVEEAIRRMEGIPLRRQGHLLSRPAGPGPEAGPGLTPLQKAAEPPVRQEPEAQRLLCPVIPASHTGRW